jgi:hypothetical protein
VSDPSDATEAEPAARWVGQTLDERYRIDAVLGEGGMGAVFRAEHLRLSKQVAVKIILPGLAGNADLATRFAREAMVTAKLEHPHIVSALDKGELPGGGAYLVMSLAPGSGLRSVMARRRGWRFACEIGAQIADALSAAHALGFVHRDLKPENVIVQERADGGVHARVLDFGIARALDVGPAPAAGDATKAPLTRVGSILGTPGYMPPEQALGDVVDARADLYSLGVLVWELAAGRRLFAQDDLREIAMAQLTEPVPALEGSDVPAELQALLDALLMPKAADRPASASEVEKTLSRLALCVAPELGTAVTEPAAPAVPEAPIPATISRGYEGAANSVARPPSDDRRSRRTVLALGGVGSALIGLLAIGGITWRLGCGAGADPAAPSDGSLASATLATADPSGASTADADLLDVPPELRADARTLLSEPSVGARAAAASRLAPERARLPAFLGHLADFELAQECEGRRTAVRALRTDADVRALAPLERIHDLPSTGCGPDHTADCHHCMRRDVDHALAALGGTPQHPSTTATSGAHETTSSSAATPPSAAPPPLHAPHGHGHPRPPHR